ncbi:MAG: glycoside hydrolase family 127 protein [Saprospiraceae bacterium]
MTNLRNTLFFGLSTLLLGWLPFYLGTPDRQTDPAKQELGKYPIQPVDIRQVHLTDNFWLPIVTRIQEKTIAYAIHKCEEEGRFENFLVAGGKKPGTVKGQMPFDDTDVYKIIEGASNTLLSAPNPVLEQLLDSLIAIVANGQEKDGYLTTWRTINPAKPPAPWVKVVVGKRWESLAMSHELYNAGHLYEAAAVHYQATGKRNFLNIALRNADLMVATFGDGTGQIKGVPGHQIIESGLIKLFEITGKAEYLQLARYFLDSRGKAGHHELYGAYSQDHILVTDQDEVVGHAVRAMYMYAAMTDIAVLQKDAAYDAAVRQLWQNMVEKKTYLTGGIGSRHDGEAFGENYELPNLTAYNETCAAIGSVYWNNRLFNKTGEVAYMDVLERTLYNGLLSGLSLDGTHFFYPNALEADGKYTFNRGACTRQGWFDCSCCPTNMIRFLPSLPGLLYATSEEAIYFNIYASNNASIEWKGKKIKVEQKTNYPWDGKVEIRLDPEKSLKTTLRLRVPSWARNEVMPGGLYQYTDIAKDQVQVTINGEIQKVQPQNGYISLSRKWQKGDVVVLNLPMRVRKVTAQEFVEDTRQKAALEYGPLVYAIEEADNMEGFDQITLRDGDTFLVLKEEQLLGGVNTLSNTRMKAIPYYAWSNRGVGKMKVWLNRN